VIGTILRVLVVLLIIRFVLRAVALWLRGPSRAGQSAAPPAPAGGVAVADLVRDQVCGTFVVREAAVRALVAGREELFCSIACRDKALLAHTRAS
jgi:hypothetical protein